MEVATYAVLTVAGEKRSNERGTNGMRIRIAAGAAAVLLLLSACATTGPPPRSSDQLRFGIWASRNGLWDEAIFRWRKVLQAEPQSVAALNNLGVAYERKGLFQDALASYDAALKIDPGNAHVKSNLKRCKENIQAGDAAAGGAKTDAKK
jgi:tetratricopeptide (TPR) repeat protein